MSEIDSGLVFGEGGSSGGGGPATIVTADSITGDGSGGSPAQLVNDSATPGNSKYYGTNGSGTKGFYTLVNGLKNNPTAGSDPGVNDDNTSGYSIGSWWFNDGTGTFWVAQSVGTGAANWSQVSSGGSAPIYPDHRVPFGDGIVAGGITNPEFGFDSANTILELGNSTSGNFSVKIGRGFTVPAGNKNVIIGPSIAGSGVGDGNIILTGDSSLAIGSGNVILGYDAIPSAGVSGSIGLGRHAQPTQNFQFAVGSSSAPWIVTDWLIRGNNYTMPVSQNAGFLYNNASNQWDFRGILTDGTLTGSGITGDPLSVVGAGSATLTNTQVGFGNVSNLMTSSPDYTYDNTALVFNVGFAGNRYLNINKTFNSYNFGDIDGASNGTYLQVLDSSKQFSVYGNSIGGAGQGLLLNFTANKYQLGDIQNTTSGVIVTADASTDSATITGNYNSVADSIGLKLDFNSLGKKFQIGDVSASLNGTVLTVDDGNSLINLSTKYINTRDDSGTFTPTSFTYTDNSGNLFVAPLSSISVNSIPIQTVAYGTTTTLSPVSTDLNVTTGTGATVVNLDPTSPVGTIIIISDLDAISSTSNITIDAQTGNTINGSTIAQTFVISNNGESIALRKITASPDQWKVQ